MPAAPRMLVGDVADVVSLHLHAVDRRDHVADAEAGLVGRALREHALDAHPVVALVDDRADAHVLTRQARLGRP